MSLESGDPAVRLTRPWGKTTLTGLSNLSGARLGLTTEGEGR
jgi:hypothetical protein